ncbi:MAG: N-acetyltransferase [Chloroflexi bacterium]|nr:MAG: N-acetyltransferase [Chloroflexota bacterium]MBL1195952.1 N-acetyltransferase [Chloroflexota bacterium]NOH13246.1 GNAT family N-acetyltransferase [Chloroflexota bacterium]
MNVDTNELSQPIGFPVENWQPRQHPPKVVLQGEYCSIEPIDVAKHARSLFEANLAAEDGRYWTYLSYGPFDKLADYEQWMQATCLGDDPQFYAIVDAQSGKAIGVASYLRIHSEVGSIEVGHINFAPALQRTLAATEAMYLMMKNVFDTLGYRRYEWKCDDLNTPSRKAALRLGFKPEGVFRQATIYKGRNRDTAWFSILDKEWPTLKAAFEAWLAPSNFDERGKQKQRLQDFSSA